MTLDVVRPCAQALVMISLCHIALAVLARAGTVVRVLDGDVAESVFVSCPNTLFVGVE